MGQRILLIEPYYGGSHKVLIDLLHNELISQEAGSLHPEVELAVMTGKKWHWRARTSALHFSQTLPKGKDFIYDTVFASCVLPLHELVALRPDLQSAKKIIYFHENQLVYPIRKTKDRDFQYGYNQVLSCLVADVVLFNSAFNKTSFLNNITTFFKLQPDYRPKNIREQIEPKCQVLYFPLDFDRIRLSVKNYSNTTSLENESIRILWPHRWEFDKNPEMFFRVLYRLLEEKITNFRLSILGENFADNPPTFEKAKTDLCAHIDHFGYLPSKEDYYRVVCDSDVVISMAHHEFFGVAMLEAAYCGCYPLAPKDLVYPEIFSGCPDSLYSNEEELLVKLKTILLDPTKFRTQIKSSRKIDFEKFDWRTLKTFFMDEIMCTSNKQVSS